MDTHLSALMTLPDTMLRKRLEWDSGATLRKGLLQEQPAAYVVRTSDLELLRWFNDAIVDRGWKHPAKPLAALLLGKKKIPLIRGRYSDPGQLRRSVRTLLAHAVARGERNAYIIGVDDALFDILWHEGGAAPAALPYRSVPGPRPYVPEPRSLLGAWEATLADLVHLPVPDSLVAAYVGVSAHTQLVRQLIVHAARSPAPVLITGPTGSGKEVIAKCIHDLCGRQPFVPLNCAALPPDLIESELFGCVTGAFTGAVARDGIWKQTGDGTLFLDEIGEASVCLQAKLLRTLEEKTIRRVGTACEIGAPARIIAATSRDLAAMINAGEFRFELYCRLSVLTIPAASLSERLEDVPELAQCLWKQLRGGGTLPSDVVAALQTHPWPGNVRELKNVLSTLHALFSTDSLGPKQLQVAIRLHELPLRTTSGSGTLPWIPPGTIP